MEGFTVSCNNCGEKILILNDKIINKYGFPTPVHGDGINIEPENWDSEYYFECKCGNRVTGI